MRPLHYVFVLSISLLTGNALADIYKCVDDSGHTTYTNDKPEAGQRKACSLMTKEQPVTTVPAQRKSSAQPSPAAFPKVDTDTQKGRDNDRRKILETELETEQKLLAQARKDLAEQEAVRLGDEKNYQKYIDRIQSYKDKVALHERNVESLNKEIAKLK
ncbi:DUF4124 domain-containing protein [Uliginosibacterium aquaticum]|uniref:DUF4124 domain-containing protein n=1 Tax=Uliginosibacterium aquaticum TaxID=2731212 RepID=A0ABX2IHJ7_9RHOO|nr:DUF4124 domain-containing protein [Uliginosibacterium aquaticum]NSL56268.1 DUF4124 domain-containing protein [Uliginosibacterium aquaticum]